APGEPAPFRPHERCGGRGRARRACPGGRRRPVNVQHAISTFRGHTVPHLRIVQNKRRWLLLSGIVIVLSLGGLFLRGINYSIDFTGGSQLLYENKAGLTVQQVQELLAKAPYNRGDAEIQIVGGNQISIRTSALTDLTGDQRTQLVDALAKQAG